MVGVGELDGLKKIEDAVLKKLGDETKEETIEGRKLKLEERKQKLEEEMFAAKQDAAEAAVKKAKHEKAWNTTKKIGRGAATVGAGLMTNLAVKPVRNTVAAMHGDTPKSIVTLFWISIIFHALLAFLAYANMSDPMFLLISSIVYAFLTLMAVLAFRKAGGIDSSTLGWLLGISVGYILLPLVLGFLPEITLAGPVNLYGLILGIRLFVPIWSLYLGWKFDIPFAKFVTLLVIGALFLFFALTYGLELDTSQLVAMGMRPTDVSQATISLKYFFDQGKALVTKFVIRFGSPTTWLNKTESYLGLNYYTSTIDDTEQEPVGFYITNVKPEDKYFYEGSPATVVADVRGKSFVDELFVVPSCYIDKKGDGIATPDNFHILGEEQSAFYCRFDGLTRGSYTAKVAATFDFETWAYLEYNFVDLEVKRSFDARHESINTALNIPTATKAVSTPGPIRLGMASADMTQPILIDKTYNTRRPVLGASMLNQWTDGQIGEVYQFIFSVPNDFELQDCSRGTPAAQANENITGYTDYIFTRDQLGDPRLTFEQVRCFLYLRNPSTFFASGTQKVKRTFIGRVKYRYKLEKSVSLIVKP